MGWLKIVATHTHLTEITYSDESAPARTCDWNHPLIAEATSQLSEYFAGKRTTFDLPLDPSRGTAFQKKVWKALTTIPYAGTASYGEIATKIRSPQASRAVGQANNRNPFSIVVPCHRVIGANGQLTGYGGGIKRKRWLLEHEAREPKGK